MATIPQDYQKDFDYLKEKSDKGALRHDNQVLQKLQEKAKNLSGLKNALSTLKINYWSPSAPPDRCFRSGGGGADVAYRRLSPGPFNTTNLIRDADSRKSKPIQDILPKFWGPK